MIISSSVIFGSSVIVAVGKITIGGTTAAAGRVGPDSTGIELIDSDKFSQTFVSAIPFNESFIEEKIELKVEPLPIALPCPAPGPAAAASSDSINDWKSEIKATSSELLTSLPNSTGLDIIASSLSRISLPLNSLLSTNSSISLSLIFLLIMIAVGFSESGIFSCKKGTIFFNSTFTLLPSILKVSSTDF